MIIKAFLKVVVILAIPSLCYAATICDSECISLQAQQQGAAFDKYQKALNYYQEGGNAVQAALDLLLAAEKALQAADEQQYAAANQALINKQILLYAAIDKFNMSNSYKLLKEATDAYTAATDAYTAAKQSAAQGQKCLDIANEHKLIPYISWGSTPPDLQKVWSETLNNPAACDEYVLKNRIENNDTTFCRPYRDAWGYYYTGTNYVLMDSHNGRYDVPHAAQNFVNGFCIAKLGPWGF